MSFTKIVATIGPSCDSVDKLTQLINEGVNVFRFNLKHNTQKWHSLRIKRVKEAADKLNKHIAVLLDLQGPEIRIGTFQKNKITLKKEEMVIFSVKESGESKTIILNNLELLQKLNKGQRIYLDGGNFEFEVVKKEADQVFAKVIEGGTLTSQKSVSIPGIELPLPTLAKKDLEDISLASLHEVDYIALSFVRTAADITILRKELLRQKVKADIIAKIETKKAIDNLDKIIKASDGVMIARGDLGVELPLEQVPFLQKEIIKKCLKTGKPVITATQMLESMIYEPKPTRAEVSDVANAIYDHTDAVMLSAESAIGSYPVQAVSMMEKIARFSEKHLPEFSDLVFDMGHQTKAVTFGAYQLLQSDFCQKENIKAFVVLTETGMTARMLSRLRPEFPIIALTRHKSVADKLCLLWGVFPLLHNLIKDSYGKKETGHIRKILEVAKKSNLIGKGDKVVMIYGEDWGTLGKSSVIRIQEVV